MVGRAMTATSALLWAAAAAAASSLATLSLVTVKPRSCHRLMTSEAVAWSRRLGPTATRIDAAAPDDWTRPFAVCLNPAVVKTSSAQARQSLKPGGEPATGNVVVVVAVWLVGPEPLAPG